MVFDATSIMPQPFLGIIGMPGPLELVVLGLVILLLFGKRLPDLMGSLGRSIVEFKKGARELEGPEASESDSTGRPEA